MTRYFQRSGKSASVCSQPGAPSPPAQFTPIQVLGDPETRKGSTPGDMAAYSCV
jgi:hypothetical protein